MKLRWDSEVEASHSNAFLLKVYNNSVYKSWTDIVVFKNEKCTKNRFLNGDLISVHSWHACVCIFPLVLYCIIHVWSLQMLMDDRKNKTTDQAWTNGLMSLTIRKITSRLKGKTPQIWPHIRNTMDVQAGVNSLLNH